MSLRRPWPWIGALAIIACIIIALVACNPGCRPRLPQSFWNPRGEPSGMNSAIRFPDTRTVTVRLLGATVGERVAAGKDLLYRLDALSDIDASGVYESGRVSLTVTLAGSDMWEVDYHIAWPEPQLNNHHLSVLKFSNWLAAAPAGVAADPVSGRDARNRAEARLRASIQQLSAEGAPLSGRIDLVAGGD